MAARAHRDRPRRRRGRFGGLYQLLSVLVIFAALLVGCVTFFRVDRVEVTGSSRYTAAEVVAASGVEIGENLFLVSRPKTANAIMKALPYVENVVPVHRLPDAIELRVTETSAVAVIEADGGWWLINESCKLLERGEGTPPADLPRVLGLEPLSPTLASRLAVDQTGGTEQMKLDGLKGLLKALKARGMAEGASEFIDLSSGSAIYFGYGEELTVVVPMSGDFDRRALSLQRTLETLEAQGERAMGTLDLTYGDGQARLLTSRWTPAEDQGKGSGADEREPDGTGSDSGTSPSPSPEG